MQTLPLIIGHRGACGYLPEHTRESFQLALKLGADVLETDVVLTRDRQLICRHDGELSITTDVADRPEFASRRSSRLIEGVRIDGWFVDDFALEEIRTLKARERFPFRDHSHDGQFDIMSLADLLEFVSRQRTLVGNPPGLIIEIKHAHYFDSIGMPMDEAIADALSPVVRGEGLASASSVEPGGGSFGELRSSQPGLSTQYSPLSTGKRKQQPQPVPRIWVECFEIDILRKLHAMIDVPLIQLLDGANVRPADVSAAGGSLTYGDMAKPAGLGKIAEYACAVGVWKRLIVPERSDDGQPGDGRRLGPPTSLIADAHAIGLAVHAWTFRSETRFLAADYANAQEKEYQQFAELGVDGLITDFPDVAKNAISQE